MKIALVLDDGLDRPDGVQQAVLAIGARFDELGHEVHYLVGATTRTDITNTHVIGRNVGVRFNHNRMTTPLPASRKKIKALLVNEEFDVIHVQMPYSPLSAGRIVELVPKDTVVVGTFHILPANYGHLLANRLLAMVSRKQLKRFDHLLAVSVPAAEFASELYGRRVDVLHNPVDTSKFAHAKKISKFEDKLINLVFLGRLVKRKGIIELMHAYGRLDPELAAKTRLIICGDGPLRQKAQSLVRAGHHVHFSGYIIESDKPNYLKTADIAIFPSTGGESFGIVLAEAMASGAGVVIGGNNPGYQSVLSPWPEALFDPKNTSVFTKKIKQLVENSKLRGEIGTSQHQAVALYDVKNVVDRLLKYYDS